MQTSMDASDYLSMLAIVAILISVWMHEESGREEEGCAIAEEDRS